MTSVPDDIFGEDTETFENVPDDVELSSHENLAYLFGNPHHGRRGQFSSEDDASTGSAAKDARYYVTQHGSKFVVHDRLWSAMKEPYRRTFTSQKDAEAKRTELEKKYGDQGAWVKVRDEGQAAPRGKSSDAQTPKSETPVPQQGQVILSKDWVPITGAKVTGELTGTVTADEKQGGGMNISRRVTVDGAPPSIVIFKPEAGERWRDVKRSGEHRKTIKIEDGTQALRDRVVYGVDQAMGFGLTPDTKSVKMGAFPGSAMAFVDDAENYTSAPASHIAKVSGDDWYKLATLDLLVGNADRHNKNVMITPDSKIVAIDHGWAFPRSNEEFRFRPNPDLVEGSPAVRKSIASKLDSVNWSKVVAPLGKPARDAFMTRLGEVKAAVKGNTLRQLLERRIARK